jgi:hypothetical protein
MIFPGTIRANIYTKMFMFKYIFSDSIIHIFVWPVPIAFRSTSDTVYQETFLIFRKSLKNFIT